MKDYEKALQFLEGVENSAPHVEAIKANVKALVEESKQHRQQGKEWKAKLDRLAEVAGGAEGELEEKLKTLAQEKDSLSKELAEKTKAIEADAKELESLRLEKQAAERAKKLRGFSEKLGADHEAFVQLLGDQEENLEMVGDVVTIKIDGKSMALNEHLEKEPAWKRAALFSSGSGGDGGDNNQNTTTTQKLPPAGSKGNAGNDDPSKLGDSYLTARYSRLAKPNQ